MKLLLIVLASLLVGAGCTKGTKSTRSFRLPEGDAGRGQAAFAALQCHSCHTVAGVAFPAPTAAPEHVVALGGEVVRLRTYGDLLTAITHPAYELSDKLTPQERRKMRSSPMTPVNEVMTVRQLVDLVVFLQPRYRQLDPLYEMDYRLTP
jgi:mono/diheme cytochrome c family protein